MEGLEPWLELRGQELEKREQIGFRPMEAVG